MQRISHSRVVVVGAGLAGSEAAWQLAERGVAVELREMRPQRMTKAHRTGLCAELVCSNSLRGAALTNAVGLLKEELRRLGSLVMQAADRCRVPAGGALAVDRDRFSEYIDGMVRSHPLISVKEGEVTEIPAASPDKLVIIATGPLTSHTLATRVAELTGAEQLAFFDAISPIILDESLDKSKVFRQSRYDKGGSDDYLNAPLEKDQYLQFVDAVKQGEKFGAHDEIDSDLVAELRPFEGCMPIEEMVERGPDTLRFGPMKPVGLTDPRTGKRPYAVVQLRQDDSDGHRWSMVGFQTRLRHPEQLRIFRTIPGLEGAEFVRLGSVHRNTFLNSPSCLRPTLQFRGNDALLFAGQITGVEGYVESTAGGLVAAYTASRLLDKKDPLIFPRETAIGSLMHYISSADPRYFQPMNISYGLMESYLSQPRTRNEGKEARRLKCAEISFSALQAFLAQFRPESASISG